MKKSALALLLAFFVFEGLTQDFDLYPRFKDENINIPNLYENTLKNEFQLMSRSIRMMDAFYATLVPGYIHFKAKDKAIGYSLLGERVLGYGGLLYLSNKGINMLSNTETYSKTDKYILWSSVGLITTSFIFDWIHGKYRLEKKQEFIRYKYSIKVNLERINIPAKAYMKSSYIPQLSFNVNL